MLKIIIHGIGGMMGKAVADVAANIDGVEVVAGVDPFFNGPSLAFPVFKSFDECDILCDVVVDFSTAKAVEGLVASCIKLKKPLVLCTTALSRDTKRYIRDEASKEIAILMSSNMSLGVNLLASLLKRMSSFLYNANFDIEIIEKHHNKKIDAPSGTALFLAGAVNKGLDKKLKNVYDRSLNDEPRSRDEIGIHAVRGGTIVGEHSVIFAGLDEIIEIKHSANSKEVFAVGAINAAKFLSDKTFGMYSMENLMEI